MQIESWARKDFQSIRYRRVIVIRSLTTLGNQLSNFSATGLERPIRHREGVEFKNCPTFLSLNLLSDKVIGQKFKDKESVPGIMTEVPARWFYRKMKGRKILLTREGSAYFSAPYFSANLLHATVHTELEPEATDDF